MPLQLPTLDDRRYADLVAEARRLIPVFDPEWTNHNPSDPGITVLELFAYLSEILLYRLDRITADNQRKFLKLLNGPDWTAGADLTDDIRTSVLGVRARPRAVTAADFERLAIEDFNLWLAAMQRAEQSTGVVPPEWWDLTALDKTQAANRPSAVPAVARATCVTSRNLERGTEVERTAYAAAHVSLVVLPQSQNAQQPPMPQKSALWQFLDARRTLTTRHHVVGPYYAPIGAEIVIASAAGAVSSAVGERVVEQLASFLDRLTGGPAHAGWPFGRDVFVSELYEQIEAIEGVDYITDLMLFSQCQPADEQCAAAVPLWHAEGDFIGLALAPHHLPLARFDNAAIVVAPSTSFVPVQIAVTLATDGSAEAALFKRQAKAQVRRFFHPRYHGPGPATAIDTILTLADLKTTLAGIAGVTAVTLTLQADAAHLVTSGGQITALQVKAGELVNWQTQVSVNGA